MGFENVYFACHNYFQKYFCLFLFLLESLILRRLAIPLFDLSIFWTPPFNTFFLSCFFFFSLLWYFKVIIACFLAIVKVCRRKKKKEGEHWGGLLSGRYPDLFGLGVEALLHDKTSSHFHGTEWTWRVIFHHSYSKSAGGRLQSHC